MFVYFNQASKPSYVRAGGNAAAGFVKSLPAAFVNTAQIPLDTARLGAAAVTRNQMAMKNATQAFNSDLNNNIIPNVGRFGQMAASTALTPLSNYRADQERKRAERLLTPGYENLYGAYGQDPRLGANQASLEATAADYNIRTDPLARSGINVNDSTGTLIRKVGAAGAGAVFDLATLSTLGLSKKAVAKATEQALKTGVATTVKKTPLAVRSLRAGGLGATGGVLGAAQMDDPNALDYIKNAGVGFATGAALPVLGEAGRKVFNKGTAKVLNNNLNVDRLNSRLLGIDEAKSQNIMAREAAQRRGNVDSVAKLDAQYKQLLQTEKRLKVQRNIQDKGVGLGTKRVESSKRPTSPESSQLKKQSTLSNSSKENILPSGVKVKSPALTVDNPKTPLTPGSIPTKAQQGRGFNAESYVKQQTKLQEAARGKTSKLSGARSEFATKGLDALSAIEKPVERAAGGREKTVTLRNQLDRSLRSDTIAGQYAKDQGFHKIVNGVKDTKAFDQYIIAKHAVDLEANGIKTGRDLGKDAQLVKELSPKYEAQAKELTKYNQKLLDKAVEYGLISKNTAAYLKEKYPNYVPFERIFSDAEISGKGNGSGPASLSKQTVIQRIKGSERQVGSPLESILAKTHDVVAQGERNLAAKEIARTAELPGNPLGLKEIKPNETIGNRSTISFIDNGQKRTFITTPEVAQAAKSLNKVQLGLVGKILSYPTRVLRLGATGANLPFAAANVVKDIASAFINSRHPVRASVANPKVFMEALSAAFRHKGVKYGEIVREGAGGTSFDIARNAAPDTIKKIRSERNVGTKALYTVRHPSELLRAVEDTIGRSEEFGRAKEYFGNKQAALKEGKSASEATAYGADAARNNTINFARAGEYGRVLNSVLPYFNAGIQSSRTLARNLRDAPVRTGAKIVISASIPVATVTAWALKDPKRKEAWDDIEDYEKEGNIIIVPPNPKKDPVTGKWNVIKIPVSQEVANLNNIVRNGVEALHKDKGFDFGAMAGNLVGTATSINAQTKRQVANQLIPQGLKPGIEDLTNQNLFTGSPIVPEKMKGLDAKDQYGKNTSGTAKVIGGLTGSSPFKVDNAIRTTLGGVGQTGVNAADNALAKLGVISPEDIKGKSLTSGIAGRFKGAQGQSEYAPIDKAIKDNSAKLKQSEGYQAMSPDEKAKALNRLENDVITAVKQQVDAKNGTGQYAQDYTGKQTKLTPRQAGLLDGTTDITDYLTTAEQKKALGITTPKTSTPKPPKIKTTKAKTTKKASVAKVSTKFKVTSIKSIKLPKISVKRPTAYKPIKTRKLSVSKIPSNYKAKRLA